MNIGILWFDNDPRTTLQVKVGQAAEHYRKRFGAIPNLCIVHPDTLAGSECEAIGTITIRTDRYILRGHLWIGVKDEQAG